MQAAEAAETSDGAETSGGAALAPAAATIDDVPALAPLEPAPPAPRMPGLDVVDRAPDLPPTPALWAAGAPTPQPAGDEPTVPAPAPAPDAETHQDGDAGAEELVVELRDAPVDIGAALAAELGVDLSVFDRAEVGAAGEPSGASAEAPARSPSPFAGMALPPSPFLRLDPGAGAQP